MPRFLKCTAPVRICDLGGWTDTWFARRGAVLSIAVFPPVEVSMATRARNPGEAAVTIDVTNYGDVYEFDPANELWVKHPLLEAAIREFSIPETMHLDVHISSEVPPGASTGTSASASVAIIAAMDLMRGARLSPLELARMAHRIETDVLKLQAGVQDQVAAAFGGINFIEIEPYPRASVSPLVLTDELLWELESRLMLVYLGAPHSSSEVHKSVIRRLEAHDADHSILDELAGIARAGKDALLQGDLAAFAAAMDANTECQRRLHPHLVGAQAAKVMEMAREMGAIGCKVNGAGGDGGSLTILLPPETSSRREMGRRIQGLDEHLRILPVRLAPQGLHRWVSR